MQNLRTFYFSPTAEKIFKAVLLSLWCFSHAFFSVTSPLTIMICLYCVLLLTLHFEQNGLLYSRCMPLPFSKYFPMPHSVQGDEFIVFHFLSKNELLFLFWNVDSTLNGSYPPFPLHRKLVFLFLEGPH